METQTEVRKEEWAVMSDEMGYNCRIVHNPDWEEISDKCQDVYFTGETEKECVEWLKQDLLDGLHEGFDNLLTEETRKKLYWEKDKESYLANCQARSREFSTFSQPDAFDN